jgi:hypothetical protein
MTWAGESEATTSGLYVFTDDGSPEVLVGSGIQLVGWSNGRPVYKQPNLNDLLNVNANPNIGDFLEFDGAQWVAGVASGVGGPHCFATGLLDTITTGSTTYVPMPGMTLNPPAGNWHCFFGATGSHNKNGQFVQVAIFSNGVESLESTRELGGQADNRGNFNSQALIATTGEAISVQWLQSSAAGGGPLGTVFQRLFIIVECEIQ